MKFKIAKVDVPMNRSGRVYPRKLWEDISKKNETYNIYIWSKGKEEVNLTDICGIVDKIWITTHGWVMADAKMFESHYKWSLIAEMVANNIIKKSQIKLFPSGTGFLDENQTVSDYTLEAFNLEVEDKKSK